MAVSYDAARVALAGRRRQVIDAEGYVLVGGRSTRFGSSKALHELDGLPMALHVAEVLGSRLSVVTLVGDPDLYAELGMPVIADHTPGAGPLGGIVTALTHTRRRWCIVAACDMPLANATVVDQLLSAARADGVDAIVPQTPDGRLQPLFAAYAKSGLGTLESALLQGKRKVSDALDSLSWAKLAVDDARSFTNINYPSDLPAGR